MKKLILKIFLWIIVLLIIICSIVLGLGYIKYKEAINNLNLDDAVSEIRASDNYTNLENMCEDYKNAVVAIEDHRFYTHNGIDILSIFRSTYVNLKRKSFDYGASTITQQVGRNIYFTQEKSPVRKIAEIFVAFDLEKNYSKDEILELYLNIIYFGNGYYGIHDASWRKKFGGKIYQTNGSHGCVNVPTSSAEKLFSMVEVGTPVYIKR